MCALRAQRGRAVKVDHLRVEVGLGWAIRRAEWKECNGHVPMDSFAGLVGLDVTRRCVFCVIECVL